MVLKLMSMTQKVAKTLVVCMLIGGALGAAADEPPLARLANGESVSEKDFDEYLARRTDLKPLARNFWGVENALREMLMTRVLVLEGLRLKEPSRGREQPERFDDIYGHAVYQKLAKTCTRPADETAARKFYSEHPEAFTAPTSVRLARVMLPASEKVDGLASMAWLMEQAQEVAKGSRTFDQIVKKAEGIYKLEPQGDLGWVNLADDIAIMKALAAAKKGEMVGPVRDGDFSYLFLIGGKLESRLMKWEDVRASAANTQMNFCRAQANKELNEKLFRQYGVVIDNNAIKTLFKIPVRSARADAASAPR